MKKQKYDFGVLGGDARQLSAAHYLRKKGYHVICYMPDTDYPVQAASLREFISCSKMLVAPLPFCAVTDTETKEDFYELLAKEGQNGQPFFSGPLPESVKNSLKSAGIRLYNPAADSIFVSQNARLTAEGVVTELLSHRTLYKSRILLIGYGNCGRAIADTLYGFSVQLTICDIDTNTFSKSSRSAPHTPAHFSALHPKELSTKLSDFDCVINTAPCLIFDRKLLQKASRETVFLDIASAPGGIDMQEASDLSITAKQLPGLPGKVSPENAGAFYAEAILRTLPKFLNNAGTSASLTPSHSAASASAPVSVTPLPHTVSSITSRLTGKTIGIALTGSFCTYSKIWKELEKLKDTGAELIFILSNSAQTISSRFGGPEEFLEKIQALTDRPPMLTIEEAEPIGPGSLLDALVIFPCTGNTAAKLSCGITDTPVLMAAKAHLRNEKPLVLSLSTNDALGMNMKNIGLLLNTRHLYFVPFGQDDPVKKPNSMTAHTNLLLPTLEAALSGKQLQPVILSHEKSRSVCHFPAADVKADSASVLLHAAAKEPVTFSQNVHASSSPTAEGGGNTCAE